MSESLSSKQRRRRMREIVERLQKYIGTYSDQPSYDDYSDSIFINDILYGLGIAIDPNEYRCGSGFDKFKAVLEPYVRSAVPPDAILPKFKVGDEVQWSDAQGIWRGIIEARDTEVRYRVKVGRSCSMVRPESELRPSVTKVDPLFCCEKYQNLVCNGACKEVSGNPSPVAVCNSAVESGSPDGAINASRCEGPADEKTVRNEACLGDGIPCATDGAGGCVACDDGKGHYRPSGKKPAIPCVWRDGCRAPEVCAAKGHCDAPTLQQNEAWKAGETSADLLRSRRNVPDETMSHDKGDHA